VKFIQYVTGGVIMTIKALREEAGLSPTQLASLAGISYPTLYKIENGQTTTHVYIRAVLSALSEKLGRVIKESDVNGLAII